jgi:hypothetical protein
MMGDLQAETARQKQRVQFSRSRRKAVRRRPSRPGTASGRKRSGGVLTALITLVQAATRDTIANGTVTFAIEGSEERRR